MYFHKTCASRSLCHLLSARIVPKPILALPYRDQPSPCMVYHEIFLAM